MPGKDLEDMTLREARKEGVLSQWRQTKKESQPQRVIDSATTQKSGVAPGDILGVRQLISPGLLASINILVESEVPDGYGAKFEAKRGGTSISSVVNLEKGMNEFSNFDFDLQLKKNDLIKVTLVDDSQNDEVVTLSEVITTIATSHE